jgi:hypothetical protein
MVNGNPADELAVLFPAPRILTIGGRTVEIKQCGIAQSARVREIGAPILQREDGRRSFDLWLVEEPAEACALIGLATDLDPDWITGLSEIDRLELAVNVWEVNESFFVRRLFPMWARIVRATNRMQTGLIASNASLSTDTLIPEATPESKPSATSMPSLAPNGMPAALAP